MLGRVHYERGPLQYESYLINLQRNHADIYELFSRGLRFLDERRVELTNALYRRVLPHMRVTDVSATVVQRIAEHIVETAHSNSLTSAALRKLANSGSSVNIVHLLPTAFDAMAELLHDVHQSIGQSTLCSLAAAQLPTITRAALLPPVVDRSSPQAYAAALHALTIDELQMFATRLGVQPSTRRHSQLVAVLNTEALRLQQLVDEKHELPVVVTADALRLLPKFALMALCHRARPPLSTAGNVDDLISRLVAAAGRAAPSPAEAAAAEVAARGARQWATVHFGTLGAQQLPFAFGAAECPPEHGIFCSRASCSNRASAAPAPVVCGCGCCFHPSCVPASGICTCKALYLARVRTAAEGRNELVQRRVAALTRRFYDLDRSLDSGDDVSGDDLDEFDVVNGDEEDDSDDEDGCEPLPDDLGAASAAELLAPASALRAMTTALGASTKRCVEFK